MCNIPCTLPVTTTTITATTTTTTNTILVAAAAAASAVDEVSSANSAKIRSLYILCGILAAIVVVIIIIILTLGFARKCLASNVSSRQPALVTNGTGMVNLGTEDIFPNPASGHRLQNTSISSKPSNGLGASPLHTPQFEHTYGVQETALDGPAKRKITLQGDFPEDSRGQRGAWN